MSGVVCAIRGGPHCQRTVVQAIALAQETGLPLHLLYVVDRDFLSRANSSYVYTSSERMHQMGEAVLHAAQSRADTLGVATESVVRQGKVGNEIIGLCRDLEADYVVLGYPRAQQADNAFTVKSLNKLGECIERETAVEVVLTENGC
jgi:nucleotide-binding universal stress UspA family protein